MKSHTIQRGLFFITGALLLVAPVMAGATGIPVVNSFSASSQSLQNNYPFALSWNMSNDAGADIMLSCPLGVTAFLNSSSFPCGVRDTITSVNSGSSTFTLVNVSGSTQSVTATLYPKDTTGTDYDAGASSVSISIATSQNPILTFTASTSTVLSGSPVTLSWSGVDTPSTNIIFSCSANVQLFPSGSTVALPCGTQAFSSDQPQSGSITITATNTSFSPAMISAHILPSIAAGTYDGTHEKTATFSVAGMVTTPNPTGTSLTSPSSQITSGSPLTLSWATQNAASANLEFTCGSGVTLATLVGTTTTNVPCSGLAFTTARAASGSVVLSVQNQSGQLQQLSVTLLPGDANGNYFAVGAKSLSLRVLPPGTLSTTASPVLVAPSAVSGVVTTAAISTPVAHAPFTAALSRGSENAQVTALQTFLAQNPSIYPDASVTGYFGALTEAAVERFQVKYNIAGPGDEGYGLVGPKTRAQLNALQTP